MKSRSWAHRAAVVGESIADPLLRRLRGTTNDVTIVSYLGHGSSSVATTGGRILAGRPVEPAGGPERAWRRLRRMAARFATRELAGVKLDVTVGGASVRAVTDDEGYFSALLAVDRASRHDGLSPGRHRAHVHVVGGLPRDSVVHPVEDDAAVLVPPASASHLVISDIDDTVLATGVGRTIRMVARTLTSSAWSRPPVPGMPAVLRTLRGGSDGSADNPCFYVSSSPWNLYPFLRAFLDRNDCPIGPLSLSDYGITNEFLIRRDHTSHKLEAIGAILDIHERLPALLVGDTTEADPSIYRRITARRPGRVAAVFLHDDGTDAERVDRSHALFAGTDTTVTIGDAATLHRSAVSHGYGALRAI